MLALGLIRGELTSLLGGGAFGFAWAYAVIARAVVARAPRVRNPVGRLDLDATTLLFQAEPPPSPPFFRWNLVVAGVHSPSRSFFRSTPLTPRLALPLEAARGRYEMTAWWQLEDFFGFTRLIPRRRWQAVLVVEANALPFTPPPPPATKSGTARPQRRGSRAGDPFDVRVYTPGDDLRRLHWPMYAHAGVPFVRTAEPSPPPSGHQFLVLDTEAGNEDELDQRLGRLTTWLARLDAQGSGWTLTIPAAGVTVSARPGPTLAALTPAPLTPEKSSPEAWWPETVTVVTGPHSRGAAALSQKLAAGRRRSRPVVLESTVVKTAKPWWRR